MANTGHVRSAADGGAVAFDSLAGFGDVEGSTIGTEYMSIRTGQAGTSGWATHAITPIEPPLTILGASFGFDPSYDGEMSDDLEHGIYRAVRPITDAPNVADVSNLYVRDDLRTPGFGSYQLISDSATPLAPDPFAKPFVAGASANFSHVIFESTHDLVPGASGSQVKLYEWAEGSVRLAGILPDGTPAPSSQAGLGASLQSQTNRMISADGSRVFFSASDGNAYMRVDGTTTVQLNASEKTMPESPQGATLWTASTDGTRIFFTTGEGLVDGDNNGSSDLYMYDTAAAAGHHLTLLSPDNNPEDGTPSVNGVVGASADGHYVYFTAAGQLVAGEPVLGATQALYLWHDGVVTFIGSFGIADDVSFNLPTASWVFERTSDNGRVSADGKHVLFMTRSDTGFRGRFGFAGYDHGSTCTYDTSSGGPCRELYVYNDDTRRLECASCNPAGATAGALTAINVNSSNTAQTSHLSHALSSDGRWVFFSTREALVPEDVNGRFDAYEYNTLTGQVHLLSSGTSTDDSYFMDASAGGGDAFFVTRQQLVGWDVDNAYDLYDARVGGGLPDPVAAPPVCAGEACQGQVNAPPAAAATASDVFSGHGDAIPHLRPRVVRRTPLRCKRGTRRKVVRGRQRCVRVRSSVRRTAKHARSSKRQPATGGAR